MSAIVGLVAVHQHSVHQQSCHWLALILRMCRMMCNENAPSQCVYLFSGVHLAEAACKAEDCAAAVSHWIHSAQ